MISCQQEQFPGGPVSYFVAGVGPALVYLHAAGGVRLTHALKELSFSFHVFGIVVPGFDDTPLHPAVDSMQALAGLYTQFTHQVAGSPAHFAGHAFGAWVERNSILPW